MNVGEERRMPRIIAEHIDQYREENGIVKCYKVGELIRCRECKYCTQFEVYKVKWFVCTRNNDGIDMNADDYCSRAERKEE